MPSCKLAWGDALIVAKEPVKAEEVFRQALQADSQVCASTPGRGSGFAGAGAKLQEAKAYLRRRSKEMPEHARLRERLAAVCLALGQKDEALVRYQEELNTGRVTPSFAFGAGAAGARLGKLELSQSEAKQVQDENSRSAEAAYILGRVHEAHNELGAALAELSAGPHVGKASRYNYAYGRFS